MKKQKEVKRKTVTHKKSVKKKSEDGLVEQPTLEPNPEIQSEKLDSVSVDDGVDIPHLTDEQKRALIERYPAINEQDLDRPLPEISRHIATKMGIQEYEAAKIVGIVSKLGTEEK